MKILIIGGGGREHALVWRLAASPAQPDLFAIPGNPGIAQIATCLTAPVSTVADYAAIAEVHAGKGHFLDGPVGLLECAGQFGVPRSHA